MWSTPSQYFFFRFWPHETKKDQVAESDCWPSLPNVHLLSCCALLASSVTALPPLSLFPPLLSRLPMAPRGSTQAPGVRNSGFRFSCCHFLCDPGGRHITLVMMRPERRGRDSRGGGRTGTVQEMLPSGLRGRRLSRVLRTPTERDVKCRRNHENDLRARSPAFCPRLCTHRLHDRRQIPPPPWGCF